MPSHLNSVRSRVSTIHSYKEHPVHPSFLRCLIKFTVAAFSLFFISTYCFANNAGSNIVGSARQETAEFHPAVKGKTAKPGKSGILTDPEKLAEIIDKAVQASEDTGSGASARLQLPVKGIVTSKVGLRHDPIDGTMRIHNGVDIAIPAGTAVIPVAPGKVLYSGYQHGYGNMVIVRHADGMITIYAHHSRNIAKTGDIVGIHTKIAFSGSTGRSTGPHLHFEAWQGGKNVTEAFLPNFAGHHISAGTDASLDKTDLRKVILSDGTVLFVEVVGKKN
jgi:murein DD-endopeptidase MepM/ murein hydrolase activator NlpD